MVEANTTLKPAEGEQTPEVQAENLLNDQADQGMGSDPGDISSGGEDNVDPDGEAQLNLGNEENK